MVNKCPKLDFDTLHTFFASATVTFLTAASHSVRRNSWTTSVVFPTVTGTLAALAAPSWVFKVCIDSLARAVPCWALVVNLVGAGGGGALAAICLSFANALSRFRFSAASTFLAMAELPTSADPLGGVPVKAKSCSASEVSETLTGSSARTLYVKSSPNSVNNY